MSLRVLCGQGALARMLCAALSAVSADGAVYDDVSEPLVICADDYVGAERCLRSAAQARTGGWSAALFLTPLSVVEAGQLAALCRELSGSPVVFCATFGPYGSLATAECTLRCSGDRGAYEELLPSLRVLGRVVYVGENPLMAPLLAEVAAGAYHAVLASLLVGVGMCAKYGLPFASYCSRAAEAIPALCQGAYRCIWSGLSDGRTFEDVDDDIHAMEMLVCRLKRSGGATAIEEDGFRQAALNRMLLDHWRSVAAKMLGEGA